MRSCQPSSAAASADNVASPSDSRTLAAASASPASAAGVRRQHAASILEVDGAQPAQLAPDVGALAGRLGGNAVDDRSHSKQMGSCTQDKVDRRIGCGDQ
jgi:hypothetical protein